MNDASPITLYFSPLACSMATRIALYEAGIDVTYVEVDPRSKRLPDGSDYREVYSLGLVPALRLADGTLLTENIAVLMHAASLSAGSPDRLELLRWLGFIATELHKGTFNPLFAAGTPEAVKAYALERGATRIAHLEEHLQERDFVVGDDFTVADAYLYTVLTWMQATPMSLADYPSASRYHRRLRERPSVARAFAEELERYQAQRAAS